MFKQGCAACEYAEKKSDRLHFDWGQKFAFMFTTLLVVVAHVTSSRTSVPVPASLAVFGIAFEIVLAVVWYVYLKNNVIGWRGPGSFLNQLGDVHTHLFLKLSFPRLFHLTKKGVWWSSAGDARVCSPLVFGLTTGWFRQPRVWNVGDEGSRAVREATWRVKRWGESSGLTVRDLYGSEITTFPKEALHLVAKERSFLEQYHQARRNLAECKDELATHTKAIVEHAERSAQLGRELATLNVAAKMERHSRPSPQARWIRGVLEEIVTATWGPVCAQSWTEAAERRHLEARAVIAEAVAQAEQRRAEASSPQSGGHIRGISG